MRDYLTLLAGNESAILTILDANLNRLREALRVVEEYYRFIARHPQLTAKFKALRHSLQDMEQAVGRQRLLRARDTGADPLASATRPEELARESAGDVLAANFKRAQESARVIEEYAKAAGYTRAAVTAKEVRFGMYEAEKLMTESGTDGKR